MNFKISLQKIICFLLAVAMLLVTAGCKDNTPAKKKKKVVKKKVVVVKKDDSEKEETIIEDDEDDEDVETDVEVEETPEKSREIPSLKLPEPEYVEPYVPEFETQNVDWAGPNGYTIVYDTDTLVNRVLANKLATFFKDKDNVILEVKEDNDQSIVNNGKLILIGDTRIKESTLGETEFAVTKLENGNIFFEGGHTTMVEKAVDWFRTIKREKGKLAILSGKQDDFVSKVNVLGKDYVYVWGDEFDGEEFTDTSKWSQRARTEYIDLIMVPDDPAFQYVENGRLRITADRYFDLTDGNVGWGAHGSCNSVNDMIFQNGYLEVKVRFDYGQGSFPAIWLMTDASALEIYVPNYEQYKTRYFNLETDIFEFFGKGTHAASNMHKWYKNQEVLIPNEDTTAKPQYRVTGVNNIDLTDSYRFLGNTHASKGRYSSFSWAYPTNNTQFNFSEEESKTLYKDYHLYQMIYTEECVKFGIDNNWYCEWPLDMAFDYIDGIDVTNNNNGIGYNLWHYLFLDQYMYPPSRAAEKGKDAVITNESAPLDSYVDYVRLYQLPDEIAIITSASIE